MCTEDTENAHLKTTLSVTFQEVSHHVSFSLNGCWVDLHRCQTADTHQVSVEAIYTEYLWPAIHSIAHRTPILKTQWNSVVVQCG